MKALKAALHCHSGEDPEDHIPYNAYEFLDLAHALAFEVVAFTCHDFFFWDKKVVEYAKKKNIVLIPGIEKKIQGKHVVILNANKEAENIKKFEHLTAIKKINDYFVFAPHPFYPNWFCLKKKLIKYIDLFDGIEHSFFYSDLWNPNRKAEKVAKEYKKTLIGTSDIHILKYMDPTYTIIHAKKNIPSILKALRNGNIEVITSPFKMYELGIIFSTMQLNPLKKLWRRIGGKNKVGKKIIKTI